MNKITNALHRVPCAGILLGVLSAVIYSVSTFTVKLIPRVNPIEIAVFRGMIQCIILVPIMRFNKIAMTGEEGEKLLLVGRGIFGSMGVIAGYAAVRLIAFSDAVTIVLAAPAFVFVFACVIMGEQCSLFHIIIVTMSMIGTTLISRPTYMFGDALLEAGSSLNPMNKTAGISLALLACLTSSIAFVLIRQLKKTPTIAIAFSYGLGCIVIGMITLTIVKYVIPDAGDLSLGIRIPDEMEDIGWILVNGITGTLGQLLMILAFKVEEAGLVSLARTMDIVLAVILQVIWLPDEAVTWTSVCGSALVILSVSVSALRRWLAEKPCKWETIWCILNCGFPPERQGEEQTKLVVPDIENSATLYSEQTKL